MKQLDPNVHGGPVLADWLDENGIVPKRGAEVGVLRGTNARYLLERYPDLLLWCVDDWSGAEELTGEPAWKVREGAHLAHRTSPRVIWQEMESPAAAMQHGDESLEFAYLDAAHDFISVTEDIRHWSHSARILAGHDYDHPDHPGVKEAVDGWGFDKLEIRGRTWIADLR